MIKIIIADDSVFMRKLLSDLFSQEPDFVVLDTASNGKEAIDKIKKLKPDLVTMDIHMPVMDGLTTLEYLMKDYKIPVVMISSLTKAGADATIKALSLGAVDFIEKVSGPLPSIDKIKDEILLKCRAAVNANLVKPFAGTKLVSNLIKSDHKAMMVSYNNEKLIAIGTSTGGPKALQQIITQLPLDLPCGVVIVQHMPAGFTKSLADRLNTLSKLDVKEAENNDIIKAGKVFIAPGNYHMTIESQGEARVIKLNQNPPIASHRPAVDVLFESVAKFGNKVIAVVLTGMGSDGAKGMQYIKRSGGYSIAEDKSTAVVYGMPKAVAELGLVDKILPVDAIAAELVQLVKNSKIHKTIGGI
ncbi:protein-glutamate methylesterase/protein-glutamine glutaminase [Anaerosinus massiliensis]|uniref:protein-glutamate methylesterase/protein-glutamine glutaminase n=1 Tax=Massilibacillus massiliensis TaxID=1806837 RepID=UPI000DA5ED8E|nr:chemotaxis response regulator protein-glutamate methylesterase [Massilibacillus massiliensis]